MNSALAIGLSGMLAASTRMDVSAHNIANSQTPDFRRQQVTQATSEEGGVTVTLGGAAVPEQMPFGGLPQDLVQQMQAAYEFKANLNVVKTQYELLGQLLDLRA
jgi:flagellar hook protein FlgE